jgi:hypothetical protein
LRQRKKAVKLDVWGPILLIASLACLETATSRGERDLWFQSNWITLALAAATILFIAFLWWDYRPQNIVRTLAGGLLILVAAYLAICYIWTPTTPTIILAPVIFLQGFCIGPVLLAAGNVVSANAPVAQVNDISTTYFFVRQLGNTFGVTAATVLFDRRMTLHSSRLLDVANRFDGTTRSTLAQYADLVHRNGGGSSDPALGALQLFQNNVITQSRLFSYIDIYFGLAMLGVVALISVAFTRIRAKLGASHFRPW